MKINKRLASSISCLVLSLIVMRAEAQNVLYRLELIRTEDGRAASYLDTHRSMAEAGFFAGWSVQKPFIGELLQGNHWEIFSLHPMISYGAYFSSDSLVKRREAHGKFSAQVTTLAEMAEFKEDLFVAGPPLKELNQLFAQHRYMYLQEYTLQAAAKNKVMELVNELAVIQTELGQSKWYLLAADAGSDTDLVIMAFYESSSSALQEHLASQKNPKITAITKQIRQLTLKQVSSLVKLNPQ